jgi:hypothetical protein
LINATRPQAIKLVRAREEYTIAHQKADNLSRGLEKNVAQAEANIKANLLDIAYYENEITNAQRSGDDLVAPTRSLEIEKVKLDVSKQVLAKAQEDLKKTQKTELEKAREQRALSDERNKKWANDVILNLATIDPASFDTTQQHRFNIAQKILGIKTT